MPFRTTLSIAAVALSLTSCLPSDDKDDEESGCSPFDPSCRGSYDYGWDSGYGYGWDSGYGGWDDPDVGPISGTAGIVISEADCYIIWEMTGPQCSGCDLGWDVDLDQIDGNCGTDTSGRFEIFSLSAYFDGDYWGNASTGGGYVTWATAGYVYGAYGYSYYYSGSAIY